MRHFPDAFETLEGLAALVEAMDLVVTPDKEVAHLAGALGKPVLVMLPHVADWRWQFEGEDSLWYPTARLLRQPAPGDWDSVLARVAALLPASG
jgi:ADP-heptose:LPS heptosyltransferase